MPPSEPPLHCRLSFPLRGRCAGRSKLALNRPPLSLTPFGGARSPLPGRLQLVRGYEAVTGRTRMSDVTSVWLFVVIFFAVVVGLFLFIARR
jgi:hypothetical protein